ncbi:MAG: double zinc ribbon domain-containing protein [Heyndrickxia sp.]
MKKEKFITEQHNKTRSFFRILGPALLVIGAICIIMAFIDFFTLQELEEPKLFWLFFVALPVIFLGFVLSGFGFGGAVAKYQSREYAPVAKDTFNYMATNTTSAVKEISNAIQEGTSTYSITCSQCNEENPNHAKYCNYCGEKLGKTCPQCEQENTIDALFCNHCGESLE